MSRVWSDLGSSPAVVLFCTLRGEGGGGPTHPGGVAIFPRRYMVKKVRRRGLLATA